jgi:hypothetical protein
MGARSHRGHLELIRIAREAAGKEAKSRSHFVNPLQFAQNTENTHGPNQLTKSSAETRAWIFAFRPSSDEMYASDFSVAIRRIRFRLHCAANRAPATLVGSPRSWQSSFTTSHRTRLFSAKRFSTTHNHSPNGAFSDRDHQRAHCQNPTDSPAVRVTNI